MQRSHCGFNASSSYDPDGTIAGYAWTFGDGTTAAGVNIGHSYAAGGNFTVALTVTDNLGATGTTSHVVTSVNTPPVASFMSTCGGLTCSFNASASSDSDGTVTAYGWAFGDGTTGSGATATHAYGTAGAYTVTLTVTDNGGATAAQSRAVTVTEAHIGDLDGSVSSQGGTWTPTVTITVHDSSHVPAAGATVTGSWSTGGTASCTSDLSGRCVVARSVPAAIKTVTFAVTGLTHATMTYKPADNHDPDGDSNGTSIALSKR
ncbi:MAG: hypothetical protein DMF80_15650 [Acidobacteria bacterium]|nr:MAG: hypothetical protein DMF80_15650 [Acidobacteriota bacterium]